MNKTLVTESPTQRYLGTKMLIAFITMMNMFIPLSMDLYLPALPTMGSQLNCSPVMINLTLSLFFFFYACGVLLWGPLSDKHGRKPILLLSLSIYTISSIGCALAMNVSALIFFRIVQGIGAGGITSISTAMVKDCYQGKQRETVLAITQSIFGLAPMIAPMIGAWILSFSDWRMTFIVLVGIGGVSIGLASLYTESHPRANRYQGTLSGAFGRLLVVGTNKSFIIPVIIFSLNALPFMGYISLSSYIYINYFKLTEQQYGYYFAVNALLSMLGPILYVRFFTGLNKKWFTAACFLISTISGLLVVTIGTISPLLFLGSFMLTSLINTLLRPFGTHIIMEQHSGDAGSVASIWNTLYTIMGSFGMVLASLPLGNMVIVLGALITLFALLSGISWMVFMKSAIPCAGVKESKSVINTPFAKVV